MRDSYTGVMKGMLVWSEMAAAYRYTDYAVEEFTKEWMEIVRQELQPPMHHHLTPMNEPGASARLKQEK